MWLIFKVLPKAYVEQTLGDDGVTDKKKKAACLTHASRLALGSFSRKHTR